MAAVFIELLRKKRWWRFALEMFVLLAIITVALLVNNTTGGHVAFGQGGSPTGVVGIMFSPRSSASRRVISFTYKKRGFPGWVS
jgi:hypothetical protein